MVKLGARMIRASIIGNLIGMITFLLFLLEGGVLNQLGFTQLPAILWGVIGWIISVSASLGIELSKDLEESQ